MRQLLLVCLLSAASSSVEATDTNAVAPGQTDVQFSEPAPYASSAEIRRRLGYQGLPFPENDITKEKFGILVPATYSTNSEWGLLVWISPSDSARIPSEWGSELAKHHVLFISAYDSGNDRHPIDRIRLALDAICNMCRRSNIDRKRIYVGGFSGGARIASMLGVAYADVFTGTLCVCGVNFYQDISAAPGQSYSAFYRPDARVLSLAKKSGRFVLLTGENDVNRENTKAVMEKGFKPAGFTHVLYLEVPGMKHAIPGAPDLNTALEYLEGTVEAAASSRTP